MRVLPLALVALLAGCETSRYSGLPPHELSMRFANPQLYAGRDDFARPNALLEMLRRGTLHRGQTLLQIRAILGDPDHVDDEDECTWNYARLEAGSFHVEFDDKHIARRFVWSYDEGPWLDRKDVW